MKYNIRKNVFETNSSSVHTLCISQKGLEKPMGFRFDKDKKIYVPLQYFGKEHNTYSSQKDKLSYICTHLYLNNHSNLEETYDSYEFIILEDMVIKYFEKHGKFCNGIKITKTEEAGIDHQSYDFLNTIFDFPLEVTDFI